MPAAIRWPSVIKPGTVYNDIFSHEDMMPTLLAAAGEPNIKEKVLEGYKANGKTFKQHLDGYNFLPYLKGDEKEAPRKEIFYFDAGASLNAIRYNNWKLHFTIMEGDITTAYRKSPSWPYVINLRADPYEVSPDSKMYVRWYGENMWLFVPAQSYAAEFLATFKEFPPQTGSSLSIDRVVQQMATSPKN